MPKSYYGLALWSELCFVFSLLIFVATKGRMSEIFPEQSVESFHAAVRQRLLNQLDGLVPEAVLTVKKLIQFGINEKNSKDGTNMRESYTQAEQFASGIPVDRFAKIARKEIKHKLWRIGIGVKLLHAVEKLLRSTSQAPSNGLDIFSSIFLQFLKL